MSYYPDIDEIRSAYVMKHQSNAFGDDKETLQIEFNRWFEYEQDKVAKATEQRIIKLLEADMEHAFGEDGKCIYEKHYREVCNCDLIALIKGENK